MSEAYTFPFQQDFPLHGYISYHSNLIGRKWLFDDLNAMFFNSSNDRTGVLVTAPMGYGKSAIVSHLLCTQDDSVSGQLRKHIIAYHICRFDVPSTRSPEVFIKRIIGFLALKSRQFSSFFESASNSSIFYDRQRCREDPVACFDQGIVFPLRIVDTVNDTPWIIMIDAFDECLAEDGFTHAILSMIRKRLAHLPKWIKFLITSREASVFTDFDKFEIIQLQNNDIRNKNDMKVFISVNVPKHNWLIGFFSEDVSETLINRIDQEDFNFLYISHIVLYLEESRANKSLERLPPTLGEIYHVEFERLFALNGNSFERARPILEILCASTRPLSKDMLFEILSFNYKTIYNKSEFEKDLYILSHYILRIENGITLQNMAIYDWLLSEGNHDFRVSLEDGHSSIALFLLSGKEINMTNGEFDITDLAIHVSRTNTTMKEKFRKFSTELKNEQHFPVSLLNSIILTTDSMSDVIKLLLHLYEYVDILNDGGVTPAFYAAYKGHIKTLVVLSEAGANLGFIVDGPNFVHSYDHLVKMDMIRKKYFWGYNLLHIAVQNSHNEIIDYLLSNNTNLLNTSNALDMLPIDIACYNGDHTVIRTLLDAGSYISSCFYYAAYNGQTEVLKMLILLNFSIGCVSDNDAKAEFDTFFKFNNKDTLDKNLVCASPSLSYNYVRTVDKTWVMIKYTPLHIAVQMNRLEIISLLISSFPEMINCTDSWGSTSLFSSVINKQFEAYKCIIETMKLAGIVPNFHATCMAVAAHMLSEKWNFYPCQFDKYSCPEGATITHLLAKHGTKEIIDYSISIGLHIDCAHLDPSSLSPFHYAVMSSNIYFTDYCSKHLSYVKIRRIKTRKEETVFHYAARYGEYNILRNISILMDYFIPQVVDIYGLSVLQYTVLNPSEISYNKSIGYNAKRALQIVRWLHHEQSHNILHHDISDRNILHFALTNGHWRVVNYTINVLCKQQFWNLVTHEDFTGYNALQFGLTELDVTKLKKCVLCEKGDFWGILIKKIKRDDESLTDIMTSQELSIYLVIRYAFEHRFRISYFRSYLHIIFSRSYILTTAVLEFMKDSKDDFTDQILLSVGRNIHPLSFLTIARYRPELLHQCNTHVFGSPMHILMKNADDGFFFPLNLRPLKSSDRCNIFVGQNLWCHGRDIFNRIFGYVNRFDKLFLSCPAVDGLNLLHRSMQFGNLLATHYLLSSGISVVNRKISISDYFRIAMFSHISFKLHPTLYHVPDVNNSAMLTYLEYLDFILHTSFQKEYKRLKFEDICNQQNQELSLIHLFAANGLTRLLRAVVQRFGKGVLNCQNKDGLTPLYLAKIFHHRNVTEFLEAHVPFKLPELAVESHLLFHLLHKIRMHAISDPWYCLIRLHTKLGSLWSLRRGYACILKAEKAVDLSYPKVKLRITTSMILRKVMSEKEIKLHVLKSMFNHLAFFQKGNNQGLLAQKVMESVSYDLNRLINAIKMSGNENRVLLKQLYFGKKWLLVSKKQTYTARWYRHFKRHASVILKHITSFLLLNVRDMLIDEIALKIPSGLTGFNGKMFPISNIFANVRRSKVLSALEKHGGIISKYIMRYSYMSVLTQTAAYKLMKSSILPSSIIHAIPNDFNYYKGAQVPPMEMTKEPRLREYLYKQYKKDNFN